MDIVTTSNFHATLLRGSLAVVFIPTNRIRCCSWPLLNLLLYGGCKVEEDESCSCDNEHVCRSRQTEIFSIVYDRDGATVFMDPNGIAMFKLAEMDDLISVAPHRWRAIQIHLGPMVAEFPGIVSFLSKLLAEDNISILNMSTYDTDIIYVQEHDLDAAITCLQRKLSRGVHGLKEAKEAEKYRPDLPVLPPPAPDAIPSAFRTTDGNSSAIVNSDQYFLVYPESIVLVRLKKEMIRENAYGLTQLVLLSDSATEDASTRVSNKRGVSFWSYCETSEEVSLLMNERSVSAFSHDSVIISPDRWKAITLCGRTFGFDEIGVVAAMSGIDTDSQVLNVSSFGSNVTLVLEHTLDDSLKMLCEKLSIPRVEKLGFNY